MFSHLKPRTIEKIATTNSPSAKEKPPAKAQKPVTLVARKKSQLAANQPADPSPLIHCLPAGPAGELHQFLALYHRLLPSAVTPLLQHTINWVGTATRANVKTNKGGLANPSETSQSAGWVGCPVVGQTPPFNTGEEDVVADRSSPPH